MAASIHAKCPAFRKVDGHTDICGKPKGHTSSSDAKRREHYDPSTEQRWTDEET